MSWLQAVHVSLNFVDTSVVGEIKLSKPLIKLV